MNGTTDTGRAFDIDAIPVETVPTPNPDALMFRVTEILVPTGTYEYDDIEVARRESPLAARLLAIEGVELVLVAPRFVTVRKQPHAEWPAIVPLVKQAIRTSLATSEMAVLDAVTTGPTEGTTQAERAIIRLIEDEIRPAIAQDGGDVTYLGFHDGIVKVRLIGACGTCPSSLTTLKAGIERLLMEEVPEVRGVEQV